MLPDSLKTLRAGIRHCGKPVTGQIDSRAYSTALNLDNGRNKVQVLISQHRLQGNRFTETMPDFVFTETTITCFKQALPFSKKKLPQE